MSTLLAPGAQVTETDAPHHAGLEAGHAGPRWLLLIHQIPADPAYLRVKVGRRLARVGALQLKGSVYVLPNLENCREDFSWIRREVVDGGGEAAVLGASLLEGLTSADLERMFREARAADYKACAERVATAQARARASKGPGEGRELSLELTRIEEQLAELERIDFFSAGDVDGLRTRIAQIKAALGRAPAPVEQTASTYQVAQFQRRTWVTRVGVKVDRVACAWLIQRFIDQEAKFKFVDPASYRHGKRELRFDMPEAEFTHEGDLCSFEVICRRFGLRSPGLVRIGEIVHDLDVKDGRYGHPETEGLRAIIQGLVNEQADDEARVSTAAALFDALYSSAERGAGSQSASRKRKHRAGAR
ncbi:MAG: chromate resistance protein [Myxococcales bacterium]